MDPKIILRISTQVYRQFPEMIGVRPKTRRQQPPGSQGSSPIFLLTYNTKVDLGGRSMARSVRVTADSNGKIIKISTSH
jgi:hypothetical protein